MAKVNVWVRPGSLPALREAALVLDLDGVVVDVRQTYRLGYLRGVRHFVRHDLGLPLHGLPAKLAAVHLLKRHPQFNAPAAVVAVLLRLTLRAAVQGKALDAVGIGAADWIAEALAADTLGEWPVASLAGLSAQEFAQLVRWGAQSERALHYSLEHYAGSANVLPLFGYHASLRSAGLWHRDRLLLDPSRPPPGRPLGVYTGRQRRETHWLCGRFQFFRNFLALADPPLAAADTGEHKPAGGPLLRLHAQLGRENLLYVGDLPADRDAALAARRAMPASGALWIGQIVPRGGERWPAADIAAASISALLDTIDA